MKIATAPVNWNSPDVPEYRPWTPYPQLLKEMQEAGYSPKQITPYLQGFVVEKVFEKRGSPPRQ